MAKPAFEFTICMTADPEKIAVKRITPTGTIQYDKVFWWRFKPTIENSLEAMAERLRALALKPRRMIVMGVPLPEPRSHPSSPEDMERAERADACRPAPVVVADRSRRRRRPQGIGELPSGSLKPRCSSATIFYPTSFMARA